VSEFGQIFAFRRPLGDDIPMTASPTASVGPTARPAAGDEELVDRIAESSGLSRNEARRVLADVLAWYREPVEDYVRRRHNEQQLQGQKNPAIFALIAAELAVRVVAPPQLSDRQLRRIVYG
jgi:hypothetical protein